MSRKGKKRKARNNETQTLSHAQPRIAAVTLAAQLGVKIVHTELKCPPQRTSTLHLHQVCIVPSLMHRITTLSTSYRKCKVLRVTIVVHDRICRPDTTKTNKCNPRHNGHSKQTLRHKITQKNICKYNKAHTKNTDLEGGLPLLHQLVLCRLHLLLLQKQLFHQMRHLDLAWFAFYCGSGHIVIHGCISKKNHKTKTLQILTNPISFYSGKVTRTKRYVLNVHIEIELREQEVVLPNPLEYLYFQLHQIYCAFCLCI